MTELAYEVHPAANAFPLIDDERLKELAADIEARGQVEPITLLDGKVIDGRNRLRACEMLGIRPKTRSAEGNPWALAWSLNGQRRDLHAGQRHAIWKACNSGSTEWEQAKAKLQEEANRARAEKAKEQHETSNPRAGERKDSGRATTCGTTKTEEKKKPSRATEAEAAAAGCDRGTVEKNNWLEKHNPDLYAKVASGKLTTSKAHSEAKKLKRKAEIEQQKKDIESGEVQLPQGVFEVIAMDPPWSYGREYDPDGSRVANPYPEMPQSEIMALEPPFADDCVLFLWTTHQFIWDAKELMDQWGFTYKATGVWDKDRMGMGHWLRMQCEFFLVGVKGKPHWENTKWRDIIRETRREHSRKPEAFYQMVEEITVGRRLEYFSRQARTGWTVFGNDVEKF